MELGGPGDEMIFDSFDHLEEELTKMSRVIEKRQMMTQLEHARLKAMKVKVHLYTDIDKERREKNSERIKHLLKTYYSYYNG